jgi:hypothetical protein
VILSGWDFDSTISEVTVEKKDIREVRIAE